MNLPGKVYTRVLERGVRPKVEPQIEEDASLEISFHNFYGQNF